MGSFDDLIPTDKKSAGGFADLIPKTRPSDIARSLVQGPIEAVDAVARGGGNLLAQGVNRLSEATTGYNPMLRAEGPLKPLSEMLEEGKSAGSRRAAALSTPKGDILKPSTWSLGEDPSLGGYAQNVAKVVGQFAVPAGVAGATAKASKVVQGIAGAGTGFLQAGGAGAEEEGERVRKMSEDELKKAYTSYTDYLKGGMDPGTARERTALDAELGAQVGAGAPGAAEGVIVQALLRRGIKLPTIGKSRPAQVASAGVSGGIAEAGQEVAEGIGQRAGANLAAGGNQNVTDDSFGNAVMGAAGGKIAGAGLELLAGGKAPEPGGLPAAPVSAPPAGTAGPEEETVPADAAPVSPADAGAPAQPAADSFDRKDVLGIASRIVSELTAKETGYEFDRGDGTVEKQEPQPLTAEESDERDFLRANVENPDAIAQRYGFQLRQDVPPFTEEMLGKALGTIDAQRNLSRILRDFRPVPRPDGKPVEPDMRGLINQAREEAGQSPLSESDWARLQGFDSPVETKPAKGTAGAKRAFPFTSESGAMQFAKSKYGEGNFTIQPHPTVKGRFAVVEGRRETSGTPTPAAAVSPGPEGPKAGQADTSAGRVSPEPTQANADANRAEEVTRLANEAATSPQNNLPEPTDAQAAAGNYKKGHVRLAGLDIAIENPEGSTRRGKDSDGSPWEVTMSSHYGYIKRTEGKDGEQVDVYVKPDTAPDYNGPVFIVNQVEPGSGKFDEHKVIIGARSEKEAQQIYDAHFSDGSGPQRRRTVGMVTVQGFKAWLKDGDTKKPFTRAPKLQGPKPEPARAERRTDSETRKRVDEMSPAEMKAEIERLRNEGATKDKAARTDRMTGLHNGLWLEENKSRFSHFVALDADGLKWINDNMGHDSGDKLLRAYGQALANASENSVKLRDGGDEFFLLANSQEEADNLVRQVEQELAAAEITATVKGERITVKGIGVSYGIGQDLEAADTRLNESKREREASGQRAGRNQQPPSVVREAASRREDSVDQDAGRDDNRVSDATPQTPSSEGVSASGARKSRLTPLNDARLKDVATQDALRSLDQEIGWAEVGGKILRDGEGDVVGRTSWIPKSPFWPGRPAAVTEAAARGAVERAITGEPLTAAQKRFVTYALDYLARETNQFAIEAEAIESFQEEIDKLTDEEQDALNDVIEDARRSLGELAVGEIQERAAIESTGAQAYAEYLRSQIREALNHQENRQEARQPAEGESGARDRPGQQGRGKDEAAGESAAPVTQQTPATAGVSASDAADFNLSGETEREIKARERRESIEREAAERKAIADRERDQFTLQPTNQPASVAKQTDMFGDPSPEEVLQARIKARSGFNAGGSLFSRGRATTGLEPSEVKAVLQRIGVEGNVVATEADLPLNLRMSIKSQGAEGQTNGLYDPLTGEIWINASRMDSMTKATVVALHESAHRGLRKLFGTGLDVVLNSIYATNENVRTQAGALMRKYRYTRERATEEVLADMAYSANAKKLVGWQRLVAFIRDWLAKRGIAINFTDDMVELIVAGAVEQGKRTATSPLTDPRLNASFSREAVKGPVFVSSLTEAIGRMMQATAPAATWKGAINNLTQKGVKAEEIEWSGVREWLDMQTGKVSKDALLAYLSNNGVQIQETELGGASAAEWQKAADAVNKAIRDRLPESEVDLLRDVRDELRDKLNSPVETKFSGYQLPGGENYRELLLTLPNKKKEAKRIQQFAERVAQVLDVSDQEARGISADILSGELDPYSAGLPPNLAGDFAAVRDAGNPIAPDFKSSHFDQPNILAHIRFNERTDADGKRVLFLEEIQSDWAQQGKRAGFANAATLGKLKNLQRVYDEAGKRAEAAWDAARAAMKRNDFLGFDNGGEAWEAVHSHADWETRWDVNPEDLSPIREYALAERARRTANNEMALLRDGVPTAPFVGKTEAWVALALKRMIRYAAENGFDRVAWTTGDQQAERYDLSKHIDRLHYEPAGEGKFEVIAFKKGAQDDSTGSEVFHEDEIDLKRIEDVFGKEIAAKIKDGAGQKIGGGYRDWHEMKGVDLKVGGEGMRAFYDKIVPNVANDVLRKLGGGRVATVAVAGDVDLHPWKVRDATDDGSGQIEAEYRTEKLAREHAEEQGGVFVRYEPGGGTEQHGFDITPALRVRSLEGVPLFSRGDGWKSAVTQKRIAEEVGNFLYTTRTFNAFHKTVGTQMHKAKVDTIPGRNPGDSGTFGKVYNIGQSYLRDVSRFANESADLAPDVLPQIRDVKDAFSFATRATKADIAAVSKVVFEGTLDKMLYSPAELKRLGLTDNQVEMYGQTREAINHSLDMLVSAEAARIAKDEVPRTVIMEAKEKPYTGAMLIAQALSDKATEKQADLPAYADRLRDLADEIRQKMERVSELKAEAYAPLMRFGQHTIYVTEKNDEGKSVQLYFGMYESAAQANRAAKVLAEEYPGADITRGILSQDSYKMFQGLSPDTLELFADLVTVEVEGETVPISQTDLYQQYLKLAVNNRSALKRMIKRKGVAGYSEDVSRVLAAFLTSNARAAAGNYHLGEMLEAVNQIPKEKGDVKDEAIALMKYLQNPQDEAAGLRSFMFIQYLGGSVASAMVNTTQPLTMTLPYLSQFGMVEAVRALKDGLAMATGMKPITSESLKAALEKAHTEGVTNPQEIHQLQAEASRNLGSSLALRKGLTLWGSLFALAEQFNRKSTFIAAFEMATAKKMPDAYRFAVNAVEETQGVYNRGNRPNLGRGALGATLLTFKQFSISYLEFLKRLPNREKALALAILMLAAGMQGLPFADDLDDVIDTIAQSLGYSFNTEDAKRKFLTRTFGEGFAGFVLYGASALPGVPLDIQGRMGLGNLIPGTGILKRSETDKTRDLVEVLGPVGGLAKGVAGAATELQGGDIKGAAMHALPVAIQNVLKGYDMAQLGMYRDLKGRKVMDTDAYEAFIKTVGFQPADVARESRRIQLAQQDVSLAKRVESEIVEAWAQGVFEKDFKKSAKAMEKLRDWNEKNPESLIRIQPSQIQRRLREMMRTRQERFVKAAPAELRGQVNADTR